MPSKSKKQQRFFGLVHAYQQGKVKNPSEDVKRVAASISESDAEHFAKTKHEGLPEKAASWLKMFKQAGGTGHEAVLAAEQAQKDENNKHRAGIDHLWSGAVSNFFLTPSYNAKHWRVPETFAGAVGDVGKNSIDNPEVWDRVKDLYFDPEYFSIPDMALTPHGSNVLQRVAKDPVNWGKVDAVTGKAIGARLPEDPDRHASVSSETVEKDSQFKEVDPYRRYNVDARAQKVLSKLLEPEDSEKEFEKKKKEVDKKVDEDKKTLRVGADALAKALNTISNFIGD